MCADGRVCTQFTLRHVYVCTCAYLCERIEPRAGRIMRIDARACVYFYEGARARARACVCVCVCEREREREGWGGGGGGKTDRETDRQIDRQRKRERGPRKPNG